MTKVSKTATFIKHLVTGNDNQTYDLKAVVLVLLALGMLIAAGIFAYTSGKFSAIEFGTGGAALLGGYGAGRLMDKDETESEDLLKSGKEKP